MLQIEADLVRALELEAHSIEVTRSRCPLLPHPAVGPAWDTGLSAGQPPAALGETLQQRHDEVGHGLAEPVADRHRVVVAAPAHADSATGTPRCGTGSRSLRLP